ncbi:MAG: flagellar protein FlgN [Oscillospiraceae bacterium]|nr:flagellar protein FlgN [Oscillospiraceae bacterium]
MRQSISDLCAILKEQKAVLTNMLTLSEEERQIIVSGQSDKLEGVIRLEMKELGKLGGIEKRRMLLMQTIAEELCIPELELTVSKIAERADSDESEAIRKLQEELTPLLEQHSAVNKENRSLIKAHVEYSQTMLELLVGVDDPLNNMYGGDGRSTPDKKRTTGLYDGHA